jgi:hypothetical protein
MKLFKFTLGAFDKYGVFTDIVSAYENRVTVDPQFHYLPVEIEEVTVDGYDIILQPVGNDPFIGWDKAKYREFLDSKGVSYTPQLGESKLRELALQYA